MLAPFSTPPAELEISKESFLQLCPQQGKQVSSTAGGHSNQQPHSAGEKGSSASLPSSSTGCSVSDEEIDRMILMYPISPPPTSEFLERHYGKKESELILKTFSEDPKISKFLGCLNYFGIASRWREFYAWLQTALPSLQQPRQEKQQADDEKNEDLFILRSAFAGFANHLGRVTTYRALALDDEAIKNIFKADEIFPTGQLYTSADYLTNIISTHGVRKVVVARLYIAHLKKLIGFDPSISLHDDWETTSCIASGYCGQGGKKVYLFQLSVPVVESLGFRLLDVAGMAEPFLGPKYSNHEPWFCFRSPSIKSGVWFDATVQRTERYGLHTMPFLQQRLLKLFCFPTVAAITEAIQPFADQQAELNKRFPTGEGYPVPVEAWVDEEIPK